MKVAPTAKVLIAVAALVLSAFPAQASLPGTEDYTNERIVPLLVSPTSARADGSGFLYLGCATFYYRCWRINGCSRVCWRLGGITTVVDLDRRWWARDLTPLNVAVWTHTSS